jgi:hypothetical protein
MINHAVLQFNDWQPLRAHCPGTQATGAAAAPASGQKQSKHFNRQLQHAVDPGTTHA